jgi:hypothetical protein
MCVCTDFLMSHQEVCAYTHHIHTAPHRQQTQRHILTATQTHTAYAPNINISSLCTHIPHHTGNRHTDTHCTGCDNIQHSTYISQVVRDDVAATLHTNAACPLLCGSLLANYRSLWAIYRPLLANYRPLWTRQKAPPTQEPAAVDAAYSLALRSYTHVHCLPPPPERDPPPLRLSLSHLL